MITNRQEKILNALIQEYIDSAEPVSSELLKKKCNLAVCPATIRNELQELTEMGYIFQPHTSAGRVPTNKAYRFFVDEIFEKEENLFFKKFLKEFDEIMDGVGDEFKFLETITKSLAEASSNLAFTYLPEKDFLFKDGWKEVFKNPEFKETDFLENFIKTVDNFEKHIRSFIENEDTPQKVKVYIGKEKSILKSPDLSLIVSEGIFPEKRQGLIAILGPKRMPYERNIGLINTLLKELEKI